MSMRRLSIALVGALGGCLSVPDGPASMCDSTSDCNGSEVCEEGVCWGDPPAETYAAVISPPSTRPDLAPREISGLGLPSDGWWGEVVLDKPLVVSGRVLEYCAPPGLDCDPTSLSATITVSRASQFSGGPGFKTVVNVDAAQAFSIPVPRRNDSDAPYLVTIVPEGGRSFGVRSAAEQVPPRRLKLSLDDKGASSSIELGGANLPVISGTLTDSLGQGLVDYRVVAIGRWEATEAATEVSSVATVGSNGSYAITLSADLVGTVDLVAKPTASSGGPTVRVAGLDATHSSQRNITAPATLGNAVELPVAVDGVDLSGAVSLVAGATVSVTGSVTAGATTFTVSDAQVTDKSGAVKLHVLNGAAVSGSYRISVIPPAGAPLGVLYDQAVALPSDGKPVARRLSARVAIRGRILDASSDPLAGVAVTARPSLNFLWGLDTAPQAFVGAIPAASTVTSNSGEFLLWVDAEVAQASAAYDLAIEPPTTTRLPAFVKTASVSLAGADAVTDIVLPDAAYVHGRVVAPDGVPVENAEIKLYLGATTTQLDLCSLVPHAPTTCPVPATLQGRGTTDATGTAGIALPRS